MGRYDSLFRIVAPHMVAGMGIGVDGIVNWSAPIVHYMVGWQLPKVRRYCGDKGWTFEQVGGWPQGLPDIDRQ